MSHAVTEPTPPPVTEMAAPTGSTGRPHARWWTRNPLRVKLVGAVLVVVALALIVIGTSSAYFLNQYLLDRSDSQLTTLAHTANRLLSSPSDLRTQVILPTDFVAGHYVAGDWYVVFDAYSGLSNADFPSTLTDPNAAAQRLDEPYTMSGANGRYRWRILTIKIGDAPLVFAQNLTNVDQTVDRLVLVEILVGAAVLVALALAGAWMVRASLRPLAAIERTAAAIAGGDLTQRVPELDPRTELGQLSNALNTMLSQIETAFKARAASEARAVGSEERMRQFVADASHELRTPLTTIRGFAELYRQGAAADPSDVLRRIEDEAARMGLLVEDLLLLARLDQERPMSYAPVALPALVRDAAEAARAVAPERAVEVDIAEPSERLVVTGDEGRLRQIVGNLVTNALAHTPTGTPVALRLHADGGDRAVIEVSDRGPGLTPEQAQRVFERFYRVDRARTRRSAAAAPAVAAAPHTGAGLGLAIVAALVSAHHGSVEVDTAPGAGATFRVLLPLAQDRQFTGTFQD